MKKENKGILLITVLFIILLFTNILEANGATYTTKSSINPGYKFEENASWNGGSSPGSYSSNTFTVGFNSDIKINGLVYLNGNLDMKNQSTLTLSDNATLIITGNFDISDKSKITIGNSASLYIKGNFTTYDLVPPESYYFYYNSNDRLYVEMDKFSNFAIEGNFTSSPGAQVNFTSKNNNGNGNAPDFYVFGDWSGTAYTSIRGLDHVENEDEFNRSETTLNTTVARATASLDNCALTIPTSANYVVGIDEELYLTSLTMGENSSLVNNGKIYFVKSCQDHTLDDFNFATTCFNNGVTLVNNGEIHCKNYNQRINQDTWWNNPVIIYNHGVFECTQVFDANYSVRTQFESSCNSSIKAQKINFYSYGNGYELNLNGTYTADEVYIMRNDGNNAVNFGSDCGTSEFHTDKLTLEINNGTINIRELTNVSEIHLNQAAKFSVDGTLILGNVIKKESWMGFGIDAGEGSIISLCYNSTPGADFGGNGQTVTSNGTVTYRIKNSETDSYYWDYENSRTPVSEGDIGGNPKLIANNVSFEQCMDGVANFLPIELKSFYVKRKGNHFMFNWITASEHDNDYFVIEVSYDGKKFHMIDSVYSKVTNSTRETEYAITSEIQKDLLYNIPYICFRLVDVDLSGNRNQSEIECVELNYSNQYLRSNILGQYSDKKTDIRIYNGELRYIK